MVKILLFPKFGKHDLITFYVAGINSNMWQIFLNWRTYLMKTKIIAYEIRSYVIRRHCY